MKNVWSLPLLPPFVVINWNISILLHSTLQTFSSSFLLLFFFFCSSLGNSPTRARAASSLFLYHTQWHTTVCRTPLDGWSVRRRDLCLSSHKRRTSMTSAAFEPPNPSKRSTEDPRPTLLGHWKRPVMLRPDYSWSCSYSGSGWRSWLVRMWTGSRVR